MANAALYRQIVDVLLAEHEKSTPPQPRDAGTARKLAVTWGLYCQVYRLARSATMLGEMPGQQLWMSFGAARGSAYGRLMA